MFVFIMSKTTSNIGQNAIYIEEINKNCAFGWRSLGMRRRTNRMSSRKRVEAADTRPIAKNVVKTREVCGI
ncbi:MAG: hypothetical protein KA144_12935 [Xanthomonadaceae bacterium]|nr:hypothetical protein [Xanthomonadaceae bacterium]